ncbi:MAG TPA: response regulator [Bdellovibrionales bacterium]|nr:response regulator [Bdellovibrionales bacterium]
MRTRGNVEILLVDDREDGLIALEALLSEVRDYELVKARSGREALAHLDHHDFAMILLDVQMPELDGFETAELIRAMPRYRNVPILFVTAINNDERYVYRGYEAGAVDYIRSSCAPRSRFSPSCI